jgi:pimeloyl-ACP methyl ester carboxylesterase
MQFRDFTCRIGDGVSIHVQEAGHGPDAAILIHGFGEGAYIWRLLAASLAGRFRTLAVDLRGHGDSSWDKDGEYRIDDHVADMLGVIDALKLERVILIGHSLGGEVVLRIAASRPGRITACVVVDFGPDLKSEGTARIREDLNESLRKWESLGEYATWLQARRPLVPAAMIDIIARGGLRASPDGGFLLKCDPALGRAPLPQRSAEIWRLLPSIRPPVLLLRGIASAVLPRPVAEQMQQSLPDASLATVERAGHAVMADNPEGTERAVQAFLVRIGRPQQSGPA